VTPIRRPLTGLLLLFVGALAIDRVALSGADERTIQTSAYFVALAFVTAPLLIRGFRRTRSGTFLAMAGAAALGLQVLSTRLTNDPYQSLVETAFIRPSTQSCSATPPPCHSTAAKQPTRSWVRWPAAAAMDAPCR